MEIEEIDDMIFPFDAIRCPVTKGDIEDFNSFVYRKGLPDEIIVETESLFILIRKSDKYFQILKRKYSKDNKDYNLAIDVAATRFFKVASRAGFNVYLDSKYSN